VARNLIAIGGRKSIFDSDWKTSDILEARALEFVGNVFTSSRGAKLCYRYKNGASTSVTLADESENHRRMAVSGRTAVWRQNNNGAFPSSPVPQTGR
jgi:hypothetical protein